MTQPAPYTILVKGRLIDLSEPQVMGILNVTPDSFYAESRTQTEEAIRRRVRQIVGEGGQMIDVGGCSTRPGAAGVSATDEAERLRLALRIVAEEAPGLPVSVDTYRADVARMCVEELGADIINDVSGGALDPEMFSAVAKLGVPYVLTHMKGTPLSMQDSPHYDDLMKEVMLYFAERAQRLRDLGAKDIILDPGYGFGKTIGQNYELLRHQEMLNVFGLPILVGFSRKSMIYKLLNATPQNALHGTTALNVLALTKGASILRVHDVEACAQAVAVTRMALGGTFPTASPQTPQ